MNTAVITEVKAMLAKDELLLGSIFNVMETGITNALEIAEKSGASNRGVVYNYQKMISSILEGTMPNSASISRNAARSISRLIKETNSISPETWDYLNEMRAK